jgi:hypothetical protein
VEPSSAEPEGRRITPRRVLPATLGTLAVTALLFGALVFSMVPAHGFGPLLPVGRVLHEHAHLHRHHQTQQHHRHRQAQQHRTSPRPSGSRPAAYHQGRTGMVATLPGPRHVHRSHAPHRHRTGRRPHNALRTGLHRLGCKLFRRRC